MRHALKKCHLQRFALVLRQLTQHAADFIYHKFLGSLIFQIDSGGDGHFVDIVFRGAFSQEVDSAIARDYGQPRRKASAISIKSLRVAPQLEKHFLHHVLSRGGTGKHTERNPIHHSGIAVIKIGHGALISRANAGDQGRVVLMVWRLRAAHAHSLAFIGVRILKPIWIAFWPWQVAVGAAIPS